MPVSDQVQEIAEGAYGTRNRRNHIGASTDRERRSALKRLPFIATVVIRQPDSRPIVWQMSPRRRHGGATRLHCPWVRLSSYAVATDSTIARSRCPRRNSFSS